MTAKWLTATTLVAFAVVACSRRSDALEPALRGEASLLVAAVDRLRQAPNPDKRAQLTALMALPCTHVDTCAVKDRCAEAYRSFVQALDDIGRIEAALVGAVAFTADDLARAEHALDIARDRTLGCASAQGELSRRLQR
jgi:hypothetical protein